MEKVFGMDTWRASFSAWGDSAATAIFGFLPDLVIAVLILVVGWSLARLAQALACRVLVRIGVDKAGVGDNVAKALKDSGVTSPISQIAARLLFWALFLTTALFAIHALGIVVVAQTISYVFGYLPNLFAAVVIIAVGIPMVRLVRGLVVSGAATAKLAQAPRLGAAAGLVVSLLVAVLALGQLGIKTELLVTLIAVFVATAGLAMGLAFALGARPLVTKILAGHFLRQTLHRGARVEFDETSGEVQRVGPVSTELKKGEELWVVPNDLLVNRVIKH